MPSALLKTLSFVKDQGDEMISRKTTKLRRRLKEPEARAAYINMGAERSVIGVWRRYDDDQTVITPAQVTMWRWSRDHDWLAKAEEYDEKVVAGAVEHLAADASVELANRARLFQMITREGTELTLLGLQRLTKHLKDHPAEILSATALSALVALSVAASKQAELLDGRPTERDADTTKAEFEKTHREIMDELDRRLANGWGPPAGTTMQ